MILYVFYISLYDYKTIGLMHDDVLLNNFTTPHSHALFARFFHLPWYSFPFLSFGSHIFILNARLGGEIDQQKVIIHKAYSNGVRSNLEY